MKGEATWVSVAQQLARDLAGGTRDRTARLEAEQKALQLVIKHAAIVGKGIDFRSMDWFVAREVLNAERGGQ